MCIELAKIGLHTMPFWCVAHSQSDVYYKQLSPQEGTRLGEEDTRLEATPHRIKQDTYRVQRRRHMAIWSGTNDEEGKMGCRFCRFCLDVPSRHNAISVHARAHPHNKGHTNRENPWPCTRPPSGPQVCVLWYYRLPVTPTLLRTSCKTPL